MKIICPLCYYSFEVDMEWFDSVDKVYCPNCTQTTSQLKFGKDKSDSMYISDEDDYESEY